MTTHAERQHAEWTEKYARYSTTMLERRIGTLRKQIDAKLASAETAKWDRRGKGQRLQSTREQRAHSAARALTGERQYVESLLASKTKATTSTETAES